jgi:hypothetical protein
LTENIGGTVCQFTLAGTYTVTPDGTGSFQIALTPVSGTCPAKTSQEAAVLFNMGTGAAFIDTGSGVSLGTFTRQ